MWMLDQLQNCYFSFHLQKEKGGAREGEREREGGREKMSERGMGREGGRERERETEGGIEKERKMPMANLTLAKKDVLVYSCTKTLTHTLTDTHT